MLKSTILLLIGSLYLATSNITPTLIGKCVVGNCMPELDACLGDSTCNSSLNCFKNCAQNNDTCYVQCYSPVADSKSFWDFDVCCLTCIANLEIQEGDNLEQCFQNNCSSYLTDCTNDQVCKQGLQCIQGCNNEDYVCKGNCIATYQQDTSLLSFIGCEAQCLSQYVSSNSAQVFQALSTHSLIGCEALAYWLQFSLLLVMKLNA